MTPQYAGLRTLHESHKAQGFAVLGFPCNQFGGQEPGTNAEIQEFARSRYQAEFPLFAKLDVNGPGAAPVYAFLKNAQPDERGNTDIPWNFTKFLVDRSGQPVARFGPQVTPEQIAKELANYL